MQNVLLILNPIAGSIDVPTITAKVKTAVKNRGAQLHVFHTTGTNDTDKIETKLAETSANKVIVAGGDGTVNLVASLLLHTQTPLGILSCGSANGLASAIELPNSLEEQIDIALGEKYTVMDCLMINDHLCLHISDLGLNAELIYNFDNSKIRGKLGYLIHSFPTLFKSNYPYHFHLIFDEFKVEEKGILLAFANASKFGTGAVINPQGLIDDGKFEVIVFRKLNFFQILKTFFRTDALQQSFAKTYRVSSSVEIRCKSKVALQTDGEYLGKYKRIKSTIQVSALKIAIPKN